MAHTWFRFVTAGIIFAAIAASSSESIADEACATPDVPASASRLVPAEYPEIARQQGVSGITTVDVAVDDRGVVLSAKVYKSSGNAALDASAVRAAKASLYSPGSRDCVAQGGDVGYQSNFHDAPKIVPVYRFFRR